MSKPLISVVMVICDVERYLAESIESILGQTFKDFEFIIVDFGSTDRSKTIAASYAAKDARVKLHEIPSCALPVARNAGCFLAQGRYIAVMDADDVSLPNRLASQVECLESHPEVALLGGATEWVDASGKPLDIHDVPHTYAGVKAALVTRCPFWHPTVTMRTEAFVSARKTGNPDPLNSTQEITPETLGTLGVKQATLGRLSITERCQWIRNMSFAGEQSIVLQSAMEILQSDRKYVEQWQIADLYMTIALIYWRQRQFRRCIDSLGRAVAVRPRVIGRPLKPLLHRLGLT